MTTIKIANDKTRQQVIAENRLESFNKAIKIIEDVNYDWKVYKYSVDKVFYRIFIENGFVSVSNLSQMKYLYVEIFQGKLMIQF